MSQRSREILAVAILVVCTAAALALVPGPAWSRPVDPSSQAMYGFLASLAAIAIFRATGRPTAERVWLTFLLALMPVVYLKSGLQQVTPPPLSPEIAGLVAFVVLALASYLVSPWFLAIGLLAHGLGWDLWHLDGRVVPRWYAWACALVDVGLAAYVAARIPTWTPRPVPAPAPG